MSKYELASYLSSLISIMESQDTAGGVMRSNTLGREYTRAYDELKEIIRKEEEDEARHSKTSGGREDRT